MAREEEQEPPLSRRPPRCSPMAAAVERATTRRVVRRELGARRLGDGESSVARPAAARRGNRVAALGSSNAGGGEARRHGAPTLAQVPRQNSTSASAAGPDGAGERFGAGHARVTAGDREAVAAADQEQAQELQHGVRLVGQAAARARPRAPTQARRSRPARRRASSAPPRRRDGVALRLDARHEEQRRGRRAALASRPAWRSASHMGGRSGMHSSVWRYEW